MDWNAMGRLGLREELENLVSDDWKRLWAIRTPVHHHLAMEFFSTFRMDVTVGDTTASAMTFMLGGRRFVLSLAEFGVQMGLYTEEEVLTENFTGGLVTWPVNVNARTFWRDSNLGTEEYHPNIKQTSITNASHRILLRVIAESISNRGNCPNNVTTQDLFYMYCILEQRPCNLARCLAIYLYERGHGRERGPISGGSFVCHLAGKLGVVSWDDLESNATAITTVRTIGMQALKSMGIVDEHENLIAQEESQDEEEEEIERQTGQNPVQQEVDPYSMQGLARQLERMEHRYDEDQRRINTQFDRVFYHQDRYQPYMDHWAQQQSEIMGQPLPAYAPPDIFMPTHRQGGFYYPPPDTQQQPRGGDGAGGSRGPQFGSYQGEPSVFPDPHMDQ